MIWFTMATGITSTMMVTGIVLIIIADLGFLFSIADSPIR